MNPVTYIRREVFGCTSQAQFAALLGCGQGTISRWERSGRVPGPKQALVRNAARAAAKPWDDRWFFEPPAHATSPAS